MYCKLDQVHSSRSSRATFYSYHCVKLPEETSEIRKGLLNLTLAKLR